MLKISHNKAQGSQIKKKTIVAKCCKQVLNCICKCIWNTVVKTNCLPGTVCNLQITKDDYRVANDPRKANKHTNQNTRNKLSNTGEEGWYEDFVYFGCKCVLGWGESIEKLAVFSKLLFSHCEIFKINSSAYICFWSCNSFVKIPILMS